MQKKFKQFTPIIFILMALCLLLALITLLANPRYFVVSALVSALVFGIVFFMVRRANKKVSEYLKDVALAIEYANEDVFLDTTVPTITVYEDGEIIWYNQACSDNIFTSRNTLGEHIGDIFPTIPYTKTSDSSGTDISYNDRDYKVYTTYARRGSSNITVIYLVDDTELKHFAYEYNQSKPSVAVVLVDNYEEMVQDYKDRERAQLIGDIENEIERYFTSNFGFVTKISQNKFMVVLEERGLKNIIHRKFDLLEKVREMNVENRMNPTLSIGIGRGAEGLSQAESMANQALDMCLGRGGDQVTIRTSAGYEFFGGISTGYEKRTKVKTRIIAAALAELIESSGNVIVMGHRFADLDALGSAIGMLKSVKGMRRSAFICIDEEKTLVSEMIQRLKENGYKDEDFKSPEEAVQMVKHDTLLVVVDAHVPHVLESEEIYEKCKNVVVIDHHRKLVGHISNAVIFYHEPSASSASEMVTELIQYFPKQPEIGRIEAEAMLAGITLDTKNFIMQTGVRTFEAAAWLRRNGADTVVVRRMFTSSMENYRQKAAIVAGTEIYHRCAIAETDNSFGGIRIVASQAADDLMNISGVDASFVIYQQDDIVNVSARSMGIINVQMVMELLGGGGHHTMAAAQFPGATIPDIRDKVIDGIDAYYETLPIEQRPKNLSGKDDILRTPTHIVAQAVELEDIAVLEDEEA